jgi:molybdopterin synthase sulfur carrier subunit
VKVTVSFFGQIKAAVGTAECDVEIAAETHVRPLIEQIAADSGAAAGRILLDAEGAPHPSLLVVLNDTQLLPGEDAALQDGDRVTLMPPISGGCRP